MNVRNSQKFAKNELAKAKKGQKCVTGQQTVLGDVQSRIDECLKRVQKCDITKGLYTTTQMAKELGMSSAQKLNSELREVGAMFCQGYEWMLTSPYSTYQLIEVTTYTIKKKSVRRPLWTERGRLWLLALKEKNVISNLPRPKVSVKDVAPKSITVKVAPVVPLAEKAESLRDEVACLMSLINEVGKNETNLLMGDIMTICTTINKHVSTLAFEAYKTLNLSATLC